MASMNIRYFTNLQEEKEIQSIFFWEPLMQAFLDMDVNTCKDYFSHMYVKGHPLHQENPFTKECVLQYFLNYTTYLANTLTLSLQSIRRLWSFVWELFEDEYATIVLDHISKDFYHYQLHLV